MLYGGGSDGVENNKDSNKDVRGGGVSCDTWAKRTDLILDLAFGSYSDSDITL